MSYLQIPAPVDHQLYLSIQYLITLLHAEAASARKQAATWRDLSLKYDPQQPRVPAGRSNGGEWTDGGGGRVSAPLPRRKPAAVSAPRPRRKPMTAQQIADRARAMNRHAPPGLSPRDLEIVPGFDLPRWYLEGAVAPVGSPLGDAVLAVGFLQGMKPLACGASRIRQSLFPKPSDIPKEKLTFHGNIRVNERGVYDKDVQIAIESAQKTGNISRRTGKYNTMQDHYHGSNGLTVIIETEGRNAGKVITTYGRKPGGKF